MIKRSFFKPLALKTKEAALMSSGIVFNPPTMLKTKFQSMAIKITKIAAPSKKFTFIKTKTTIGKKASTGTDWSISKKGSRYFSTFGLETISKASGTEKINDKKYTLILDF